MYHPAKVISLANATENKSSHSFTIQPEDRLAINFISKDIERYTGAYTASKKSINVVQRFMRNNYILHYLQCIDLEKFAANIFIELTSTNDLNGMEVL